VRLKLEVIGSHTPRFSLDFLDDDPKKFTPFLATRFSLDFLDDDPKKFTPFLAIDSKFFTAHLSILKIKGAVEAMCALLSIVQGATGN
jgi:hypothetical protein